MNEKEIVTAIALIALAGISLWKKKNSKVNPEDLKMPSKAMLISIAVVTIFGLWVIIMGIIKS